MCGFYLQHAAERILVGRKGTDFSRFDLGALQDVVVAQRLGQSQKPFAFHELLEKFCPSGDARFCELFARINCLRDRWVSIGNEIVPADEVAAGEAGVPTEHLG